jgi:DNA-binding CsgD family transcriptional regulator
MSPLTDRCTFTSGLRPHFREQEQQALPVMLERALDMLDCALLIVDDEGKVAYRNRVATALLERAHGGLILAEGVLSAKGRELREGLARAIRLACDGLQPSGLCVAQPGALPGRWLRLVVAPIYFGASAGGASRAAIWVLNTEAPALPSEELLGALFGLSRAEARLARCVLLGRSTAECARHAGVGIATIRTQLHSIFTKTGVTRQAQLVALLSRVPVLQLAGSA